MKAERGAAVAQPRREAFGDQRRCGPYAMSCGMNDGMIAKRITAASGKLPVLCNTAVL
jgi:hypothetical protein